MADHKSEMKKKSKFRLIRADAMMDEHKVEFEKRWQQEVVRLKTEQAVYNDQVIMMRSKTDIIYN